MSDEVTAELQDEYSKVKIGLAATGVAAIVGVFVGTALGVIDASNEAAKIALPAFTLLVGVAVGFFFRKKE